MISLIRRLLLPETGTATIEFSLIAGLVALTVITLSSAPTISKSAFLKDSDAQATTANAPNPQLWELVEPKKQY